MIVKNIGSGGCNFLENEPNAETLQNFNLAIFCSLGNKICINNFVT